MAAEKKSKSKDSFSSGLTKTLLMGVIVLLLLLAFSDLVRLIEIFRQVSLLNVFLAGLATVISYLLITWSYRILFTMVHYQVSLGNLFMITVVSTLINYFVATGGASGYALRAILLKKKDVPATVTFSVSLIQGVITNLSILLLFLISLLSILLQKTLNATQLAILLFPIFFLILFISLVLLFCFYRPASEKILNWVILILAKIERWRGDANQSLTGGFTKIKEQFYQAIGFIRDNLPRMWIPGIMIIGDWIFSMVCLYICFVAVNHPLNWKIVATVYFVGIFISFVFVATGGLGIMEGGMAAVFTRFGVPWETALAAVLLYRVIYYIIPLLLVLLPYLSFIRSPVETVEDKSV